MIRVLVLLALASAPLAAQANPFVPGSTSGGPTITAPRLFGGAILDAISDLQRDLNQRIAALARQARDEPTAAPVILALCLAFVWGMVHAVGPGHGKTFTLSYFLAVKPRIGRGILFGALISLLDSVSAFVLVFLVYIALKAVVPAGAAESAARTLRMVSYVLITSIGVWQLVSHLRGGEGHGRPLPTRTDRRLVPLAVSIGLVPCPVSTIVLVFGLSIGAFGFGVILTLFLALGAAAALTIVAFLAMALRSSVLAVAGAAAHARVIRVLEVGGASLVVVFGAVLLVSVI